MDLGTQQPPPPQYKLHLHMYLVFFICASIYNSTYSIQFTLLTNNITGWK